VLTLLLVSLFYLLFVALLSLCFTLVWIICVVVTIDLFSFEWWSGIMEFYALLVSIQYLTCLLKSSK